MPNDKYDWCDNLEQIEHTLHIFETYKFDTMDAHNAINDVRNILDDMEKELERVEMLNG